MVCIRTKLENQKLNTSKKAEAEVL